MAVFAADVERYSRLMGGDEVGGANLQERDAGIRDICNTLQHKKSMEAAWHG